jgi:hypothetical protein
MKGPAAWRDFYGYSPMRVMARCYHGRNVMIADFKFNKGSMPKGK